MVNKELELIIHPGAPKTGTSSIQQTLRVNKTTLNKESVKYLGLMLEFAELKKHNWQNPSDFHVFYQLPAKKINEYITEILSKEIQVARENSIKKLIWSNESFLGNMDKLTEPLKNLQTQKNINIKFIIYVRDYSKWTISAYKQWAIKHKTYNGEIQKFSDYKGLLKYPLFYEKIKPLINIFENQVIIRNMDSKNNVVEDFLKLCDIDDSNINIIRSNDTPSNEELYLRALFNNLFKESVLPHKFDNIVRNYIKEPILINNFINDYFPTENDLINVKKSVLRTYKVLIIFWKNKMKISLIFTWMKKI
jgi:hypothetical protein